MVPLGLWIDMQIAACSDMLAEISPEDQNRVKESDSPDLRLGYLMGMHDALVSLRGSLSEALKGMHVSMN